MRRNVEQPAPGRPRTLKAQVRHIIQLAKLAIGYLQHHFSALDYARKVSNERTSILGSLWGNPRLDSPFVNILQGECTPQRRTQRLDIGVAISVAPGRDRLEADAQVRTFLAILHLFLEKLVKRGMRLRILLMHIRKTLLRQCAMNIGDSILVLVGNLHPRAMVPGRCFLAGGKR